MNETCTWNWMEVLDTRNGTAVKWRLKTDCGHEVIMTRDNRFGKLWRQSLKPHPQGTQLEVKCPHCECELDFWNDFE